MVKSIDEDNLKEIEDLVRRQGPKGMTAQEIAGGLASPPPPRTLQFRLKNLVDHKRLLKEGERRWTRYVAPHVAEAVGTATIGAEARGVAEVIVPLSRPATEIGNYVRGPVASRKPVGYDRAFLDAYRPRHSFYLTEKERAHLQAIGTPRIAPQPAGTYAKQIFSR